MERKSQSQSRTFIFLSPGLFLLVVGFALPAQGIDYPLIMDEYDSNASLSDSIDLPNNFPPARRWRTVNLNPLVADPEVLTASDVITLNLFPDAIYTTDIDRIDVNINDTVTVRGRIDGFPHGYFLISTTSDATLSVILIPEQDSCYRILSNPQNQIDYLLEVAVEQEKELEDAPSPIPPPPTPEEAAEIERLGMSLSGGPLDPATVDVMIVYTPAAKNWASGDSGIANVIAQAMAKAQLSLDNSNTILTMTLVHSAEVSYTESGSSITDIQRLTYNDDGYMDEVHTWRNEYGADLVALLAQVDDVGGVGWLLTSPSGSPSYGFSLTRVQQASWTYTLVHEMGHNMGCHHRKDQVTQPGPGLFSYSAGWRWIGNDAGKYCSVMSYQEDGYGRVAHFSNPNILYQGVATGDAVDGDNARTLREIKHVVAAYRPTASVPLAEAVDAPSLSWATGGSADWFGQTDITHDGSDAGQSGDIGDSQQSWMQTEVTGPGQLSYWWKVSSESNGDFLRFYLDDAEQAGSISGEVDWQQKNISVPSGSHILKWVYAKDVSVSSGGDCGWVDQVDYYLTPVHFEDANLKAAVEERLGIIDPNADDMLNLTYLNASSRNIISLVGLECAMNLNILFLANNSISDLSPLANLMNLTQLYLRNNQISDISAVANLTNLMRLALQNNQISDISAVANLTSLTRLVLQNNQISDISAVAKLTNLTTLWLSENPLNTPAYCTWLGMIQANNPELISFDYDPNPNPLTDDCSFNLSELAAFLNQWLDQPCTPDNSWCNHCDVDHNALVNLQDYTILADLWLR